ncbi:MAG TPA: hypothetical protein VFR88_15385 [Microlunatus sp.]|nr:hypothetical protein [Microlunatus sp.]
MSVVPSPRLSSTCPPWCAFDHRRHTGEDDTVHVSGALMVRRTVLRLCMTHDPSTGVQDGPYVLVGAEEYSLHEADALVDALTQLVDRAGDVNSPAAP